ncbi:MAG: integrase, partial [Natronomonas sp.]
MSATLDAAAYERLREAATTGRERLVVRLAGEAGVRPAEQTRLRPGDIDRRRFEGESHHFLSVRGEDDEPARRTYLSADLARAIDEYAATTGTDPNGRLIDVTPRRVQMLINEVADRAAESTGNGRFDDVSSDDLRRYFARRLLTETDVDPRVVRAVGGWDRLAALDPYVGEVEDADIAAAFADGHRPAIAADDGPSFDDAASVVALELDADGRVVGCSGAPEPLLGYADDSVPGT